MDWDWCVDTSAIPQNNTLRVDNPMSRSGGHKKTTEQHRCFYRHQHPGKMLRDLWLQDLWFQDLWLQDLWLGVLLLTLNSLWSSLSTSSVR